MRNILGAGFLLLLASLPASAAVTAINAQFHGGKTYLTWQEEPGDSTLAYNIYRSRTATTDPAGLVPVARIRQGSGRDRRWDRYCADAASILHNTSGSYYHTITDTGAPLSPGTGLFVYTPRETAQVYYAVAVVTGGVENPGMVTGQNSLANPVGESYWPWPRPVLVKYKHGTGSDSYLFYYWVDYLDWNHSFLPYGDFFSVAENSSVTRKPNVPLWIYLHGSQASANPILPSFSSSPGFLRLFLQDHAFNDTLGCSPAIGESGWYGVTKAFNSHCAQTGDTAVNYVQMKVIDYFRSIVGASWFSIDTNRIYVTGASMGGSGTYRIWPHLSQIHFAAVQPYIGRPFTPYGAPYSTSFLFGKPALNVLDRSGEPVYDRLNIPLQALLHPERECAPLLAGFSSDDWYNDMWMYVHLFRAFAVSKHGAWGEWVHAGHAYTGGPIVPGGFARFRKNEVYPCLANASRDDNYGQFYPDTFNARSVMVDSLLTYDTTGIMNGYIDWTSSLHDMDSTSVKDDLMDNRDTLAITFKSSRENTLVDITPRRIQNFPATAGATYLWRGLDMKSGATTASGRVTSDGNGLLTVERFAVAMTGTRLVITCDGNCPTAEAGRTTLVPARALSLKISPNPFNPARTLVISTGGRLQEPTLTVYGISGRMVVDLTAALRSSTSKANLAEISWKPKSLPCGLYLIRLETGGASRQARMIIVK